MGVGGGYLIYAGPTQQQGGTCVVAGRLNVAFCSDGDPDPPIQSLSKVGPFRACQASARPRCLRLYPTSGKRCRFGVMKT